MNTIDDDPRLDGTEAQQGGGGGCQQEPCSLSSGSEVDAAFPLSTNWHFPDSPEYLQQRAVAVKMESQRDAAIAVLMAIEERYIDGCDTYEDWKFMGDTARAFLSENEQSPSVDENERK